MRILRITKIKDYRIFQNWEMQPKDKNFSRFNIIYGGNGSGKSTLVSLLLDLVEKDWTSGAKLQIKEDNQQTRELHKASDTLAAHLRIFNADYVKKNLLFDKGELASLLFLGKESIDNQVKKGELESDITTIKKVKIPKLENDLKKLRKESDEIATKAAKSVVSKLQGIDDKYNARRYTRREFRRDLTSFPQCDMSNFDIDQQVRRVALPTQERIEELLGLNIPLNKATAHVAELLSQTVTSEAIETLKNKPAVASWVQTGMQLHKAGEQCLFCENIYTLERANRLSRHFDESLIHIQQEIATCDRQLVDYQNQCKKFIASFSEPPRPLDEGRTKRWINHVTILRKRVEAIEEYLVRLRRELGSKREALFQPLKLSVPSMSDTRSDYIDIESINSIIREHNRDIDNYESIKEKICKKVVQYYIEQARNSYTVIDNDINSAQDELNALEKEYENKRKELQFLHNGRHQNLAHFAELLTTDLHHYFGRDELTLELSGNAYSILRNGKKAENLSEGEQRSIALLYFLRDIESNDANLQQQVIIFDDPVSSIDDGAATGAFAYIWDKCVGMGKDGAGQLFILTHNFDFFRRWINGLSNTFRNKKKAASEGEYTIRELRTLNRVHDLGRQFRSPTFVDWDAPERYAQLRSEYHYLFWRAANLLVGLDDPSTEVIDTYDTAMLPNVCRKLLEGFLSFRYPQHIGNFRTQMSTAVDKLEDSASRNYMLRLMHEYSHNEQCDIDKPIQLIETPKVVRHIFETIRTIDERHYEAMCEALGVSPLAPSADSKGTSS